MKTIGIPRRAFPPPQRGALSAARRSPPISTWSASPPSAQRARRRLTTRRWSASSCSAASTATTCSSRSTPPATRNTRGVRRRQLGDRPDAGRAAADHAGERRHALRPAPVAPRTAGAVLRRQARAARQCRHADCSRRRPRNTRPARGRRTCTRTRTSRAQWQTAIASGGSRTGWGGRLADAIAPLTAARASPCSRRRRGSRCSSPARCNARSPSPASGGFGLAGFGAGAANQARLAALNTLLGIDRGNTLVDAAADITQQALALSATVNPILARRALRSPARSAGSRRASRSSFSQIAKMIEARAATGAKRQIFFASLGSFDTHNDELARSQNLFDELSPALKAFYDATVALGRRQPGHDLYAVGFRPHVQAGRGRRQRPRLGQPPLDHGRRRAGRKALRRFPATGPRRPG